MNLYLFIEFALWAKLACAAEKNNSERKKAGISAKLRIVLIKLKLSIFKNMKYFYGLNPINRYEIRLHNILFCKVIKGGTLCQG